MQLQIQQNDCLFTLCYANRRWLGKQNLPLSRLIARSRITAGTYSAYKGHSRR